MVAADATATPAAPTAGAPGIASPEVVPEMESPEGHNRTDSSPESQVCIGRRHFSLDTESLEVGYNQLTSLPESIGRLQQLTELGVHSNPLKQPPLTVAQRGVAAIRAFFDDMRAGTAVARSCMLVLIGDAEMGKTSLLNGLLNGCTPNPAPAGPDGRTIHVAISPLALGSGDAAVEFKCYDLGGQQKSYAAAQQAYIAPGALYLLVVSAEAATTESHEERLRWWLHFLQTNAPGAVVQPVLTHADKCATEAEAAERVEWIERVCRAYLNRLTTAGSVCARRFKPAARPICCTHLHTHTRS